MNSIEAAPDSMVANNTGESVSFVLQGTHNAQAPNGSIEERVTAIEQILTQMKEDVETLKINAVLNPDLQESKNTESRGASKSIFRSRVIDRAGKLDNDTFTMMMRAETCLSKEWLLGLFVFILQAVLAIVVIIDVVRHQDVAYANTPINIPIWVSKTVLVVQFITIIMSIMLQTDLIHSIRTLVIMGPHRQCWKDVVSDEAGVQDMSLWTKMILIPNLLKLTQGILVLAATYVLILQSDGVTDLLMNFSALFVVSAIDDLVYAMANSGFLGVDLSSRASHSEDVEVKVVKGRYMELQFRLLPIVVFLILLIMTSFWVFVIFEQRNGSYAEKKFPSCFPANDDRYSKLIDQKCEREYNKVVCGFDGGACEDFNERYPNCDAEDPSKVGNGECNYKLNSESCGFDDGDCLERNNKRDDFQCMLDIEGSCDFTDEQNYDLSDILHCGCLNYTTISEYSSDKKIGWTVAPLSYDGSQVVMGSYNTSLTQIYDYKQREGEWLRDTVIALPSFQPGITTDGILVAVPISLALSSDNRWLVVGDANYNDETGISKVFSKKKSRWTLVDELQGAKNNSRFGMSVDITHDGSIIAVGAPGNSNATRGHVTIFVKNGTDNTWIETKKLKERIGFGYSLSISSNHTTLVIGSPYDNHGKVYYYDVNNFKKLAVFEGDSNDDFFGGSVSISDKGERVAVGANAFEDGLRYDDNGGEYVRLFEVNVKSGSSTQIGNDIRRENDKFIACAFGWSISLSGDGKLLAVGAPRDDNKNSNQGAVFVYSINNYTWSLVGNQTGGYEDDWFGLSVALSGDGKWMSVGSPRAENGTGSGIIRLYGVNKTIA